MPISRPRSLGALASICFLLLLTLAACRKYDRETLELLNPGANNEEIQFKPTEEKKVSFTLRGSAPVSLTEVRVECAEPSISGSHELRDSSGFTVVTVTLRTDSTQGGVHPVRITFIDKNESFAERNVTINVLNFAQLLRDPTRSYLVVDTLSARPFDTPYVKSQYSLQVRQLRTDPPNRFIFSNFGTLADPAAGYIEDVVVDVDSITGELKAGAQTGILNYSGRGWLRVPNIQTGLQGYFIYSYDSSAGQGFVGHLSF